MVTALKESQRNALYREYMHGDVQKRRHAQVVLLYCDGWTQDKIANTLKLEPEVVATYLAEYRGNRSQRKKLEYKLDTQQTEAFIAHLDNAPQMTVKDIGSYVEKICGYRWPKTTIESLLKSHGFTYRKKQIVKHTLTPKWKKPTVEYRSTVGWFRN